MARIGVTQEAVNAAADQLLLTGERPTIERVRAALGTGSPNTLIRLLDVWWAGLGHRLQAQAAKLAVPEAPAAVTALATALWEQALEAAQSHAEHMLAHEQNNVACDRAALDGERLALHQVAEAQAAQVAAAQHAETVAHARLADAARLVDQQAAQLSDLGRQRDAAQQRADRLELELTELHARLREQQAMATAERDRHAEYVAALENRTSVEIDRARQEARALRHELVAAQREHARALGLAQRHRDEATTALATAQQDAATQRARVEALERQQVQLTDLAATVQDALKQAQTQRPGPAKVQRTRKRNLRGTSTVP